MWVSSTVISAIYLFFSDCVLFVQIFPLQKVVIIDAHKSLVSWVSFLRIIFTTFEFLWNSETANKSQRSGAFFKKSLFGFGY